jgi:DNA segregation ATPase FtsK/SpoIIIE, S-DNA-T family
MSGVIPFDRRRRVWPWVGLGCFTLIALMSESASALFVVIVAAAVMVWVRLARASRRRRFVESFDVSVRHAIDWLLKPDVWVELCTSTGLCVRLGGVLLVPGVTAIRAVPTGAEISVRPAVGQSVSDFERARSALQLAAAVPAVRVQSKAPGDVTITLATVDPLAQACEIASPVSASADLRRLPAGIDEAGQWVWLSLADTSGWAVGGVPGSGKTSALSAWLASLALSPVCQFAVFDGKGGGDWSGWSSRAFLYSDTDDLHEAAKSFAIVDRLLQARLQTASSVLNTPNAWIAGFRDYWPLVIVLIDECQTYLDSTGLDKAAKAASAEISRTVSSLIRRGRSAGILTVLATQKPTTDSIPSSARDNAGLRTCFAVSTDEAAVSVLGPGIRGSDASPVHLRLPYAQGVCTLPNIAGGFCRIRVPYLAPHVVAHYLATTAGWRRDPLQCLASAIRNDL